MVKIDGAKVKRMREAKGLTQLYLATAVEVTTDTISRWENKRYPKIKRENALKLAEALEVDLQEILDAHVEMRPDANDDFVQQDSDENDESQRDQLVGGKTISNQGQRSKVGITLVSGLILIFVAFAVWFLLAERSVEMEAVRIVPAHVAPGQPFPVVLKVEISKAPSSFILKEQIPKHCSLTGGRSSGSVHDSNAGEIKWITKAKSSVFAIGYMLQSESKLKNGDTLHFLGNITQRKTRGVGHVTSGRAKVFVSPYHWADTDENGLIDDEEILVVYDDYNEVSGLTINLDLIEEIWFGSGYEWDERTGQFTVLP